MPDVHITEFTDPGCPWAFSAEPFRRRLNWLYGDRLEWEVRLVGLSERPEDYEERGFGPEQQAAAFKRISGEHGMPIDTAGAFAHGGHGARLPVGGRRAAARAGAHEEAAATAAGAPLRRAAAGRARDDPGRRAGGGHRAGGARGLGGRGRDRARAPRGHEAGSRADAGGAHPRPQAGELVWWPAIHVPLLRDRPHCRRGAHRGSRLPALRRLRRDHGQPGARHGTSRAAGVGGGGAHLDGHAHGHQRGGGGLRHLPGRGPRAAGPRGGRAARGLRRLLDPGGNPGRRCGARRGRRRRDRRNA